MLDTQKQVDARRKEADRNYGYRLFEAGQSIKHCTTIDQVRGWQSALNACAYAESSEYLVRQGVER